MKFLGDDPGSEAAKKPFKFSRGHLQFINEVYSCLWKDESSVWSSQVLRAKQEIERVLYDSFSLLMYREDPEDIKKRIAGTPFWKRIESDEKHENEIIDAFVTGTCYYMGPRVRISL